MSRPFYNVDPQTPIFDGNLGVCFSITLTANMHRAVIKNIAPGVLYTFIIQQDDRGGHSFDWPVGCNNASAVSLEPKAMTVQNFVGTADGTLSANLPGTVTI